ncbi:BA75_04274T0 [Komagataella pastoris]|uniref:BA75_04274T0 n=1 Tax=Komagataella pastoris TaxID=4922 RepID=A0A1B2JFI4_PICPA|nr:BA75_04274T0 [Komagataella pastoris]
MQQLSQNLSETTESDSEFVYKPPIETWTVNGKRVDGFFVPGGNVHIGRENTWGLMVYNINCLLLHAIFWLYSYYIVVQEQVGFLREVLYQLFWSTVQDLTSGFHDPQSFLSIPYKVAYRAQSKLMAHKMPTSPNEISVALPKKGVPAHIGLELEFQELVIGLPPRMPQPYLTADKIEVKPSEKEIQRVQELRAKYKSQKKAHYVEEKLRILTDCAKLIAWSAYTEIKTLSLYVKNDEIWDFNDLTNIVKAELNFLEPSPLPSIKLMKLNSNECFMIDDVNTIKRVQDPDHPSTFCDLTVILLSEKDSIVSILKEKLALSEGELDLEKEFEKYGLPVLILHPTPKNKRSNSLNGFPIHDFSGKTTLYAKNEPLTFSFFTRAINDFVQTEKTHFLLESY